MVQLVSLVKRNCKLFFKDKGMFFSSLITPFILLVLYVAFLGNVYKDAFIANAPEGTSMSIINGVVAGQLLSSLLAVSCVTVAFCANLLMVQDKVTESRKDLTITPVKKSILALGYYIATLIVTLIICLIAVAACFIYIAFTGWFMSFLDVILVILDIFLLVMFGTALSSIVNFFLTSQGQMSAVGMIVSCVYGFICGAYTPISQFATGLQNVLAFLPSTYATALLKNHAMRGVMGEISGLGWPSEAVIGIQDSIDYNLYFFGTKVSVGIMFLIVLLTVIASIGIYVLINVISFKKIKKEFNQVSSK